MNRNLEKPGQRIKPVPAFSEYIRGEAAVFFAWDVGRHTVSCIPADKKGYKGKR